MRTTFILLAAAALAFTAVCDRNNPYDPASDNYRQVRAVKNLSGDISRFGATALDGSLYMIGGYDTGSGTETAAVDGYIPGTDEKDTTLADLPAAVAGCMAASCNGRVYVLGGSDGTSLVTDVLSAAPGDAAWRTETPMPVARRDAVVTELDGYLYVIGGETAGGAVLNRCDRFDPAAGTWTAMAPMGTARARHAATVSGGRVYVGGGQDTAGITLSSVETYNPAANTWSPSDSLLIKHHSFIMAASNGYLFALDSGYDDHFEERDSTNGGWYRRDLADPDGFATRTPAVVIDDKIYSADENNILQFLP